MRITIVGGGSIGRIFCYLLGAAGNQVTMLDIDPDVVSSATAKGVCFVPQSSDDLDEFHAIPIQATVDADEITQSDLVILTVKSSVAEKAAQSVSHLIKENCPLLCFQTGLTSLEKLQAFIHSRHILVGVTHLSGTALGGAKVRLGGIGLTYIGELTGEKTSRIEEITQLFNHANIATEVSSSVMNLLWEKVLLFSAINPISSILKVPNGCLTSKPIAVDIMQQLLNEGWNVAKACSIHLEKDALYPALFEECIQSSNNLSPMLQDLINNKSTEIDCQNGAIIQYAKEHDLEVPTHHIMLQLIKILECTKPGSEQIWFP